MGLTRVRETNRGPSSSSAGPSRTIPEHNYSFVLHEPSTSEAVTTLAAGHHDESGNLGLRFPEHVVVGREILDAASPDTILTAHIGAPLVLQDSVSRIHPSPGIVAIDAAREAAISCLFFRAPARLVLPDWEIEKLFVAATIMRSGGNSVELVWEGPFHWSESDTGALPALERLILAHVDQWFPPRTLWSGPAEELLPEVLDEGPSPTVDSR